VIVRDPKDCRCKNCEIRHRAMCELDCGKITRAMLDTLLAVHKCTATSPR